MRAGARRVRARLRDEREDQYRVGRLRRAHDGDVRKLREDNCARSGRRLRGAARARIWTSDQIVP
jgi:hypothetical protein